MSSQYPHLNLWFKVDRMRRHRGWYPYPTRFTAPSYNCREIRHIAGDCSDPDPAAARNLTVFRSEGVTVRFATSRSDVSAHTEEIGEIYGLAAT